MSHQHSDAAHAMTAQSETDHRCDQGECTLNAATCTHVSPRCLTHVSHGTECHNGAMLHGTASSYAHGCRCDACRTAGTEAARERRRRKALAELGAVGAEPERPRAARQAAPVPAPTAPALMAPEPTVALAGTQALVHPHGRRQTLPRPARPARRGGHQVTPAGPVGSFEWYTQAMSLWIAGLGPSPTLLLDRARRG
jgi:hypothetical protein